MSKKELDNLFKSKLSNLEQTPSADAWQKVQSQLPAQRKKAGYWFMRVAAALLLLMLVGTYFWVFDDGSIQNTQVLASEEVPPQVESPVEPNENQVASTENESSQVATLENSVAPSERNVTDPSTQGRQKVKTLEIPKEQLIASAASNETEEKVEHAPQQEIDTKKSADLAENAPSSEKLISDATQQPVIASHPQTETGTTLEFDLSDFSKIEKTQVVVQDTGKMNADSGIKKMLAAVKDVKESGLVDLRQKKNEILALNFMRKKNEERNQ